MANILFFVLHEVGSLNASFRLAGELRERGHAVAYAGVADSRALVEANGFAFICLFESFFPSGSLAGFTDHAGFWRRLAAIPRTHAMMAGFVGALLDGADGEVFDAFDRFAPDLVLLSGGRYAEWPALMAASRGIPIVYLGSTLAPRRGSGLPPMSSALIPRPDGGALQGLRISASWAAHDLGMGLHCLGLASLTRRLAEKYGVVGYQRDDVFPMEMAVTLPEIIPFPRCFDFPGVAPPDQYFIEPSVSVERNDGEFRWRIPDDERPLAYCALGTYRWRPRREYLRFFRAVLGAAARTPDWRWVIALGGHVRAEELGAAPENALLVDYAPQLQVLKRADVMIGHAGANSVKECVFFGVPSVLLPLGADQPGIAARARYHGLALCGDFHKATSASLEAQLRAAATSPFIKAQLRLMRARFLEAERSGAGVALVEALLRRDRRASVAQPRAPHRLEV
jgi:MGT family glycosyltransferase